MFRARFLQMASKITVPSAISITYLSGGISFAVHRHLQRTKMKFPRLTGKDSLKEFESIKTQPQVIYEDSTSKSTDISGFTSLLSAKFAGNYEANFKLSEQNLLIQKYNVKGLDPNKTVCVFRGEARPLPIILDEGITPKSPHAKNNLFYHRRDSDHSNFVSFTSRWDVAAMFGARSADNSHYGTQPTLGNGEFHILYAELPGKKYDIAGPSDCPLFFADESEVTVAGRVDPQDVKGFRHCQYRKEWFGACEQRFAKCFGIFVRKNLSETEKQKVFSLLNGKDPKEASQPQERVSFYRGTQR